MTTETRVRQFDAFHCRVCGDTGQRRNESWENAGQERTIPCFCNGGVVWVLVAYSPPWYAAERWPERDIR